MERLFGVLLEHVLPEGVVAARELRQSKSNEERELSQSVAPPSPLPPSTFRDSTNLIMVVERLRIHPRREPVAAVCRPSQRLVFTRDMEGELGPFVNAVGYRRGRVHERDLDGEPCEGEGALVTTTTKEGTRVKPERRRRMEKEGRGERRRT